MGSEDSITTGSGEPPSPPGSSRSVRRSTEVCERIAALLNDAESTAEQIRADAERAAQTLLREAEQKGRARLEELTGTPERLRAEAEGYSREVHAAADAYADEQRRSAAEEGRRTRVDAAREAEALRAEAQLAVRGIEEAARARLEELHEETRLLEQARERTLGGLARTLRRLRESSQELEQLLAPAAPAAPRSPEERSPTRLGLRRQREESEASETVYERLRPGAETKASGTPDQLYEQAKALRITGRSRMTREELVQAVKSTEAES